MIENKKNIDKVKTVEELGANVTSQLKSRDIIVKGANVMPQVYTRLQEGANVKPILQQRGNNQPKK